MTARMLAWKQPFIQRVRNSSLVERPCAENDRASSPPPKPWVRKDGRGALQWHRSPGASPGGAFAKANVGMSNDKRRGKRRRRKTKGSLFYANQNRVSRDLRRTRKGKSMANGLIFPYLLLL